MWVHQSTLCHVDSSYAFSIQSLEENKREEEERRNLVLCLLFLSVLKNRKIKITFHFHVASPCLQHCFLIVSLIWLSLNHPHHPFLPTRCRLTSNSTRPSSEQMPSSGKDSVLVLWNLYIELLRY